MYTWLENLLGSVRGKKKTFAEKYWKPFGRYIRLNNREIEGADNGYWSRSREEHAFGQFSYAVVQANANMEDFSQVEVGLNGTFAGVYDGHGGHEAAWFVLRNLFPNLIHFAQGQRGSITESVFKNAFAKTELDFIDFAELAQDKKERNIFGVGSCVLTGLIWNKTLFVCHLGDSRAVLGRANKHKPSQIFAEQLSRDHNVNLPDVRREVQIEHEYDDAVVRQDENNVWRIKGIIQISRAIGDLYLKDSKYSEGHTRERITKPVINTDPEYHVRAIEPTDRFVILASDGLWEHLDNQKAVDIVAKNPRSPDIAKKLIKEAMKIAARKQRRSYRSVRKLAKGARRPVHDDISVIVLFIDENLLERSALVEEVSWKAFSDVTEPSEFRNIYGGASSSGTGGGEGPSGGGDGSGPSGYGGGTGPTGGGDGSGPSGYGGGGGPSGGGDGAGPSGYGGGSPSSSSDGSSSSGGGGENRSGGGEITETGGGNGKAVMEG